MQFLFFFLSLVDFTREDITEGQGLFLFKCKYIRIGQHKFDAKEKVAISNIGIKLIAPTVRNSEEGSAILNIQTSEIAKVLYSSTKQTSVMFLYVLPSAAGYVRECLEMSAVDDSKYPYFNPASRDATQSKIIFVLECESIVALLQRAFEGKKLLDEITVKDAQELLIRSEKFNSVKSVAPSSHNHTGQILIYPSGKGGISIYTDDYFCLAIDQYLNDVIIDFYLKYLLLEQLSEEQRVKTHVFSTFFYKRLTTIEKARQRPSEKDPKMTPAQKRHLRVKNWTKNVDLSLKEFIIIPINEQSHWFLAIVCFPTLNGPVTMEGNRPVKTPLAKRIKKKTTSKKMLVQIGNTTITPVKKDESINIPGDESERDEAEGDDSELNNTDDSGEEDTADPESQPLKQ